jgi:hypothetical protein
MQDILISENWLVSLASFSLLHLAEVVGHLELGSCLFLHLLDSHARCNFSKSETTVLTVNLENTLSTQHEHRSKANCTPAESC